MSQHSWRFIALAALWGLLAPLVRAEDPAPAKTPAKPEVPADKAKPDEPFVRIVKNDKQEPISLQTAVVRYVSTDPAHKDLVVDLVGAIHVGDKSYYEALNKRFEQYDVLLYELVAPEGTKIPKGGRQGPPGSAISALQLGMKSMLELDYQLEIVDYTKDNFVHADMSPEEFAESMKNKGESWMQMFFRMLGQGLAQQANKKEGATDADLLFALFAKDRPLRLKRIMADQMGDLELQMAALEGPDGSTILTERNKKALAVLDREIKAGKKKIGIFYGAAHLPDMQERLLKEFKLKRSSEEWLPAWEMGK
jgi:hypothetical protein